MHATRSETNAPASSDMPHEVVPGGIRGIVCLLFDPGASSRQIRELKEALIASPHVLHAVELTGAYDFMLEASAADMTTFDEAIHSMLHKHAKLLTDRKESFVCRRSVRPEESDSAVRVPLPNGMKRIDCARIDKIKAEGDYMRIHSGGSSWLLHRTMQSLASCLREEQFVQIHRSAIVRCSFVESIINEDSHHVLHLADGSCERVSRSRVGPVIARLKAN